MRSNCSRVARSSGGTIVLNSGVVRNKILEVYLGAIIKVDLDFTYLAADHLEPRADIDCSSVGRLRRYAFNNVAFDGISEHAL